MSLVDLVRAARVDETFCDIDGTRAALGAYPGGDVELLALAIRRAFSPGGASVLRALLTESGTYHPVINTNLNELAGALNISPESMRRARQLRPSGKRARPETKTTGESSSRLQRAHQSVADAYTALAEAQRRLATAIAELETYSEGW
jgi:hypothetical protein